VIVRIAVAMAVTVAVAITVRVVVRMRHVRIDARRVMLSLYTKP
jgi:hypothetical protein